MDSMPCLISATEGETVINVYVHDSLPQAVLTGRAGGQGDSTGLMLWAGASALASAVQSGRKTLFSDSGDSFIELGSGCGIVGALCARYSKQGGVVTDGSIAALCLAERTLQADACNRPVGSKSARTAQLCWPDADAGKIASCQQLSAACISAEHSLEFGPCTRLVLGAELIYPSTTYGSMAGLFWLARTILSTQQHEGEGESSVLSPPLFLLSYVPRAPETTIRLFCTAQAAGWRMHLVPRVLYSRAASETEHLGALVLACRPMPDLEARARTVSIDRVAERAEEVFNAVVALPVCTSSSISVLTNDMADAVTSALSLSCLDTLPAYHRGVVLRAELEAEAADNTTWAPPVE